jgi:hypothetical protein
MQVVLRHELEKADDLYTIFNLLAAEYASFLSYDIFQSILARYMKKCNIPMGQEELMYPEHLKAYIHKLRVSEFVEINPLLKKYTATSTELVLKIDTESISTLADLENIKAAIAKILGVKSATLRLVNVEEGCVLATYLIPKPIADSLFTDDTVFSKGREKNFVHCQSCDWNAMAIHYSTSSKTTEPQT